MSRKRRGRFRRMDMSSARGSIELNSAAKQGGGQKQSKLLHQSKTTRPTALKGNRKRRKSRSESANPLDELAAELERAGRLERATILFVVGVSEAVRTRAAALLEAKLGTMGTAVAVLDVAELRENDVPLAIKEARRRAHTVFFVQGLERGGERALNALNFRREYFSELRARVVFWLTPADEKALAREATDFWAFRDWTVVLE